MLVENFGCAGDIFVFWWHFFFASFLASFKVQNLKDSCVKYFILTCIVNLLLDVVSVDLCNTVWRLSQWSFQDEPRLQLYVLWVSVAHCIYWHIWAILSIIQLVCNNANSVSGTIWETSGNEIFKDLSLLELIVRDNPGPLILQKRKFL